MYFPIRTTKKRTGDAFRFSGFLRSVDFICHLLFARMAFRTSYEDLKYTLRPAPVSEFSSVFRKRQLSRRDTFLSRLAGNANYTSIVATRACHSSNSPINCSYFLLSSFFPPRPPSCVWPVAMACFRKTKLVRDIAVVHQITRLRA